MFLAKDFTTIKDTHSCLQNGWLPSYIKEVIKGNKSWKSLPAGKVCGGLLKGSAQYTASYSWKTLNIADGVSVSWNGF